MKFIRDIISEKRSVRPAVMPLPAPTSNDDHFEEPAVSDQFHDTSAAMPLLLGPADHQIASEGPDGVAADIDADNGTGQFAENRPNIFANDDGPSDEVALAHATDSIWYRFILELAIGVSSKVLTRDQEKVVFDFPILTSTGATLSQPQKRPEILPFVQFPTEAMAVYEISWKEHLVKLQSILTSS